MNPRLWSSSVRLLPVLTQGQGTPFSSFHCLCFTTVSALWTYTPPKHYLHGDPHNVDLYRPALKVCVCGSFPFLCFYLSVLWTMTTLERQRQQIRGFPLQGLWLPGQHSWQTSAQTWACIPEDLPGTPKQLSWHGVVVVVAIVVAAGQRVFTGVPRCTQVHLRPADTSNNTSE